MAKDKGYKSTTTTQKPIPGTGLKYTSTSTNLTNLAKNPVLPKKNLANDGGK
jgi:hypothetical protein